MDGNMYKYLRKLEVIPLISFKKLKFATRWKFVQVFTAFIPWKGFACLVFPTEQIAIWNLLNHATTRQKIRFWLFPTVDISIQFENQ